MATTTDRPRAATARRRVVVGDEEPYAAAAGIDADVAYRALTARDPRFDGRIWVGVTSTGIYCRPVCPAQTPRREHVRFFVAPAAAVSAGFRACKRCRPDAQPGTRQWDHRGDLVGRALRLIGEGAIDDGGVAGLARSLHVSERHLHRALVGEVGAGPLQLALSRRAQTARMLVDQTAMPLSDVAFAAGFSSIRQFNDVMRREFGMAPSELRRTSTPVLRAANPALALRLRFRAPYDADAVGGFLAARAVPGVEHLERGSDGWSLARTAPLRSGVAHLVVSPGADHVLLRARDVELRDTAQLVGLVRRWLDLDADPVAIGDVLGADEPLAARVTARPGLRVPTTLDRWETVLRALLGQQVTLAVGVTLLGRLVALGAPDDVGAGLRVVPAAATVAALAPSDIAGLGMPRSRAATVHAVATAVASGGVDLDGDPAAVRAALLAVPGVGPWTVDYVALRALGDPDAFPATDLVLRRAAAAAGLPGDQGGLTAHAERWRPWRAYAAQHLWTDTPPREDHR